MSGGDGCSGSRAVVRDYWLFFCFVIDDRHLTRRLELNFHCLKQTRLFAVITHTRIVRALVMEIQTQSFTLIRDHPIENAHYHHLSGALSDAISPGSQGWYRADRMQFHAVRGRFNFPSICCCNVNNLHHKARIFGIARFRV